MRPEDYMTHDEALEVDGCMVCNRLDCICPPEEELSRTEATTDYIDNWYKTVAFDHLWQLSLKGDDKATEELLARQWEYNKI